MRWLIILFGFLLALAGCSVPDQDTTPIVQMVHDHARAWETGDSELLDSLLADNVTFAYPGRRLDKNQTIEDFVYFSTHFTNTTVYINKVIISGNDVAVEWQFATTEIATSQRQVVSDAIIAHVSEGKFDVWKEYLDGRVKLLQATGELGYEEGSEPYPWPLKTEKYGKK